MCFRWVGEGGVDGWMEGIASCMMMVVLVRYGTLVCEKGFEIVPRLRLEVKDGVGEIGNWSETTLESSTRQREGHARVCVGEWVILALVWRYRSSCHATYQAHHAPHPNNFPISPLMCLWTPGVP